ncbi:MAG: ATPase P [Pseudomonadota bacterium]
MIELNIPGREQLIIRNLVLDLNGTIALDGKIIEGVPERLQILGQQLEIFIVTADTRGKAEAAVEELAAKRGGSEKGFSIKLSRVDKGKEDIQKLELVRQLGIRETLSMGNGANDARMLKECIIGVCVMGPEGAAVEAIMNADLVTSNINDALDVVIIPERIMATLRK